MDLDGVTVTVAGTGYTGEDGVEIAVPAAARRPGRGTPSSTPGWLPPGWAPGTPSASKRACRCTATSWARASPRSRRGWDGSWAGTRATSGGVRPWRPSGTPGRPAVCGAWCWTASARRGPTSPSSTPTAPSLGAVTSGNYSPDAGPGHRPGLPPPRHRTRRPGRRGHPRPPRARRGRHPTLRDVRLERTDDRRAAALRPPPPRPRRRRGRGHAGRRRRRRPWTSWSTGPSRPASARTTRLELPEAGTEDEILARLPGLRRPQQSWPPRCWAWATRAPSRPTVILRNVMENPAWYTAYTPYQPEISQGRLEALLNFQTMVTDLTGMDLANASLLDEATAAAEAMALCRRVTKRASATFFVDAECHPQTIEVVATRAEPLGIKVIVGDPVTGLDGIDAYGVLVQYPGTSGGIRDLAPIVEQVHEPGRARRRGRRPAGPDPAGGPRRRRRRRRGRLHPALRRAPRLRRPPRRLHGRAHRPTPVPCPAAWSGCRSTRPVAPPTGWPCRPGSSTSAGRRPPATSAPPRSCWRSWPRCTPCTTAPTA